MARASREILAMYWLLSRTDSPYLLVQPTFVDEHALPVFLGHRQTDNVTAHFGKCFHLVHATTVIDQS